MRNKEVDCFIIKNYMTMSNQELSERTGRTLNSIQARLTKLGLKRRQKIVLKEGEEKREIILSNKKTG